MSIHARNLCFKSIDFNFDLQWRCGWWQFALVWGQTKQSQAWELYAVRRKCTKPLTPACRTACPSTLNPSRISKIVLFSNGQYFSIELELGRHWVDNNWTEKGCKNRIASGPHLCTPKSLFAIPMPECTSPPSSHRVSHPIVQQFFWGGFSLCKISSDLAGKRL